MVMEWERCRQVPHRSQGGQDLWIMHSMQSSWTIGLAMPWCLLPFARRDHSRGHMGEGGVGAAVVAAVGWNGKQSGGSGYKSPRN